MITRDKNGRVSFGRFDYLIQFLIVVSLVTFAVETLPDLGQRTRSILYAVEVITVIIFTIEWVIRAALLRPSKSYIFSFFGMASVRDSAVLHQRWGGPAFDSRGSTAQAFSIPQAGEIQLSDAALS